MPRQAASSRRSIAAVAAQCVLAAAFAGDVTRAAAPAAETGRYQGPDALAVAADGRTLYVANTDADQVAWVALPGGSVTRRVNTPTKPTGLALSPDGRRLYVTCAAPKSTIAVLDACSGATLVSICAGHTALAPVVSPDGRRLYVCNRFNNDVSIIDTASNREVARVAAVREPIAAALTPDGRTLLVANHLPLARTDPDYEGDASPMVTVIDTQSLAPSAVKLPHGSTGVRGICLTPDGRYAFVTHLLSNFESVPFRVEGGWINTNVVTVIDVRNRKVMHTVGIDAYDAAAGNPWAIACSADGLTLCVTVSGTHELAVIDTADVISDSARIMTPTMGVWPIYPSLGESYWRRIKLPGQGPRGLAVAGGRAYAAQYYSDSVAVVDLAAAADAPVAEIAVGPPPELSPQRRGDLAFHDATLCNQHWQSCSSCHPDGRADALSWDLLNDGEGNSKNTKSLLFTHQTPPAMWEGVRTTAEQAVRSGFTQILFAEQPEETSAAVDAYLKSLRPEPSPHLVNGRLSPAAQRGRLVFQAERIGCNRCHLPPLYTDLKSHNVGSRDRRDHTDKFVTPSLVEAWRTAPYLHDGRYTTLSGLLVEGRHGLRNERRQTLSPQELQDLIEFVLSL